VKNVREQFLDARGWGVFEAEVTGYLYHRRHLKFAVLPEVEQWGKFFDYALVVRDDKEKHGITRLAEETETYSGYLWQCLVPTSWLKEGETLHLNQVYFIWEHTDFTKEDAIRYNLDSLERKRAYLEARHGDMVVLQKSCGVVPGEPACPTEVFYDFVVPPETIKS